MMVSYVDRRGRRYRRRAPPVGALDQHAHRPARADPRGGRRPRPPESNPAVGKRSRLKASKPRPVHLDSAEQIALLLEATGQLDRGEAVIGVSDRHGRT
jgi:hypothetical protein